jgi:predicted transcriptional regulator
MTKKRHRKKRGRPCTGHYEMVGVRLPKKLLKAVDKYAEKLFPYTRSAVIRKAVEDLITPPPLQALRNTLRDVRTKGRLEADERALEKGQGLAEARAAIQAAILGAKKPSNLR